MSHGVKKYRRRKKSRNSMPKGMPSMTKSQSYSTTSPKKRKSGKSKTNEPLNERDQFLLKWLKDNQLKHLFVKISQSQVNIAHLSTCDEATIREAAKNELRLTGKDLALFERSLMNYNKTQALKQKSDEVSEVIDSLEYTKNEINIKRKDDISYLQNKFKLIRQSLKKRENELITEIKKKVEYKSNLLNEQILSLKQYKSKLNKQNSVLMKRSLNSKKKECIQQNKKAQRLLRQNIEYDKEKFLNINKMCVDLPHFDNIIEEIKKSGDIVDEWEQKQNVIQPVAKTKQRRNKLGMDCICGKALVLTNVDAAYPGAEVILCNFCRNKCFLPYNGDIYHCPRGDHRRHPGGFDLCLFCGQRCLQARKLEQNRAKEEKERKKLMRNISTVYDTIPLNNKKLARGRTRLKIKCDSPASRRSKSYSSIANPLAVNGIEEFLYSKQLRRLEHMGYDQKYAAKLLIKHEGNMVKIMAELLD